MTKRQARLDRLKAVERQYRLAELAIIEFRNALRANPSLLAPKQLRPADFRELVRNLEPTYVIRLYAEFEGGLRDVWVNCRKKKTTPPMKDLLNALAAWRSIPADDLDNAHTVRKYRNSLVHEGGEEVELVPMERARKYLCTFFGLMPLDW